MTTALIFDREGYEAAIREAKEAALEEAAAKLEMLARWKFGAGCRIWAWSDYGKNDRYNHGMGEKGLMMCSEAGQMERDALRLRGIVKRRRRWL